MRCSTRVIALAVVCLGTAIPAAHAQVDVDPYTATRFQVGPLGITPSIALSNLGTDGNVFNESADPKKDTTAAIGPAADLVFRAGRSRLSGKATGQYLYFQEYDGQRSWNTNLDGTWRFPLVRITPFVLGSRANTKDRPGYEIDSRARRIDRTAGFGSDVRLSSKTKLVLTARRSWFRYDDNQQFLGVELADRLNRRSDSEEVQARVQLTPLTTFVVRADAVQDRFDVADIRDADSFRVMPGFELRPQALISGEAFVGVRRFATLSDAVPDYSGVVAAVKAKYALFATRLGLNVQRDITYSYEALQPFYALTDVGGDVTQRITRGWDVVIRGSRQSMAYKNVVTAVPLPKRTDRSWMGGGGIGYRVGETLRLGFDANYYRRTVDLNETRNYEGLRLGASISYGLPQ